MDGGLKTNCASRLHSVLSGWKPKEKGKPALSAWMSILRLKDQGNPLNYFLVGEGLQLLFDEMELLRLRLQQADCSSTVYEPVLSKISNALSPGLLNHQTDHIKQHLTEDVFIGLAFCSEFLPVDQNEISEDQFKELVSLIGQLEIALEEPELPSDLVILIRRHVALAEKALAMYPIAGAKGIKEAVKYALGDMVYEQGLFVLSPDVAEKVKTLWRGMNKVADGAIKVYALHEIQGYATKLLSDLNMS